MFIKNLKKSALALAIIIVMNVFFNVGVQTFYPMPEYGDFCMGYDEYHETELACTEADGEWVEDIGAEGEDWSYCTDKDGCWDEYDEARDTYEGIAFIILTVLGIATLLIGLFVKMPSAVVMGLSYGGVLSIIIGTMRYWYYMDDILQFVVSGLGLFALILIGVKKLKD